MDILTYYGPVIGSVLARLLKNAKRRIYIMSMTVGRVSTIRVKERTIPVYLDQILKARASEGVEVYLILKDPDNLNISPEKKRDYLRYLDDLALAGIHIFFCWHMHMKVIIVDDSVYIGSSNITLTGLKGLGEIAVIINDAEFADRMARQFKLFLSKKHEVCLICDMREKNVCGFYAL